MDKHFRQFPPKSYSQYKLVQAFLFVIILLRIKLLTCWVSRFQKSLYNWFWDTWILTLDRDAEPDNFYYIQNQSKVAGKKLDLAQYSQPDLVVEIDI